MAYLVEVFDDWIIRLSDIFQIKLWINYLAGHNSEELLANYL
jgi:hypothetical protein